MSLSFGNSLSLKLKFQISKYQFLSMSRMKPVQVCLGGVEIDVLDPTFLARPCLI